MKKIFVGFLMVFLDFNLNLNGVQIGLIPDFIGYIVMVGGLAEMTDESPQFPKVRPHAVGMAVYTGILYGFDLTGISVSLGDFSFLLSLVSVITSLYISWCIVAGVREMEEKYGAFLNGDKLKSSWMLLAIFNAAAFIALLFPGLAVVVLIATAVIAILFLTDFAKAKTLYYDMKDGACMPMGGGD